MTFYKLGAIIILTTTDKEYKNHRSRNTNIIKSLGGYIMKTVLRAFLHLFLVCITGGVWIFVMLFMGLVKLLGIK